MNPSSDRIEERLQQFDIWLQTPEAAPREDFLERLKIRLHQPGPDLEERIDALFRPDPQLYDPDLSTKIRQRLKTPSVVRFPWFQWAAPLAATLVLGFAFYSFQQSAPTRHASLPTAATAPASLSTEATEDPELTRIFALASNLQANTDMARLKSVDDLAYLFD